MTASVPLPPSAPAAEPPADQPKTLPATNRPVLAFGSLAPLPSGPIFRSTPARSVHPPAPPAARVQSPPSSTGVAHARHEPPGDEPPDEITDDSSDEDDPRGGEQRPPTAEAAQLRPQTRGAAQMCGYLLKMGGQRGLAREWHQRYVVLQGGQMVYYLTHEGLGDRGQPTSSSPLPKSKAPYPLRGAIVHSPAKRGAFTLGKHAALSFEVRATSAADTGAKQKALVFSAPSAQVLEQWLVALQSASSSAPTAERDASPGVRFEEAAGSALRDGDVPISVPMSPKSARHVDQPPPLKKAGSSLVSDKI